ncbi:DUF4129 domain-containing protein [Halosimplex salinum]|uniref:DUF4129 domain-containing protein n=1 Tax=Halosimplex salinum TaxID=1710538 RepID=UPI0013DDA750|nr:DUF4129 domain-containing protein [Halosimplex salinum]
MTRSGHRAVLVALGVLAVALGGALFPATGFGSAPAGDDALFGSEHVASGDSIGQTPDQSTTDDGGTPGATPGGADDEGTPVSTATEADSDSKTAATPERTATPEPTPEPTATPTEPPNSGSGIGETGLELAVWLFLSVLLCLALAALASMGGLLSSGGGGGSSGGLPIPGFLGKLSGLSPARVVPLVPQMTMVALVGVSTGTARVLRSAGSVAGQAAGGLGAVVRIGSRSATTGLFDGLSGLFALPDGPLFSVSGVFSGLHAGGSGGATGDSPAMDARSASAVDPERGDDGVVIRTVEDAWEAFAEPLPVADPEARTPGEFARVAIERGDPAGPVRRLRDVFRDVRYGGLPATEDRTRSAIESVGDILATRDEEEGER